MEVTAITRSITISPRKVRLVADSIRKLSIVRAFDLLSLADKRAAGAIVKTLKSAVANAVNNKKLNPDTLAIASIDVSDGTAIKRFHPSSRGRVHPYKKRTSHIRITLKTKEEAAASKKLAVKV